MKTTFKQDQELAKFYFEQGRIVERERIKKLIFQKYDCGVHYERLCKIIDKKQKEEKA